MQAALSLARAAALNDEVPVGAVIVKDHVIIGSGLNTREATTNVCAHAELMAVQEACHRLKSWRLDGCELFVTLEPCVMCAGALQQARIQKVTFAAFDPKGGALGSLYQVHQDTRLNHQFQVDAGICEQEAAQLLKSFFAAKRKKP